MLGFLKNLFNSPFESLDANAFGQAIEADKHAVVLDVRRPDEFRDGHLRKARNLNVMSPDFAEQLQKLDKEKSYYVYCRSGARSSSACSMMIQQGFSKVYNLSGGIMSWRGKLAK
ncbi:MAG: hypothetical protein OHK0039_20330 [Bacteroidia bacterium]